MDGILKYYDNAGSCEADAVDLGAEFEGDGSFLFGVIPYHDLSSKY